MPEGAPPVETVREVARLADSLVLPAREWVRLRAPAPLRAPGTANALCLWPAAPLRPDSAGPPPSLFNNYTVRLRGGPAGRRDELTAYVADGYGRGEALFIPLAPAGVGVRAEERQELAGALCLGPGPGRLDVPSAPYTEAVLSSYSPLTLRRVEWRSAGPLRPAAPPPALQPAACGSRQGAARPPPAGTRWRTLLVWDGGRRARRLEMALPAAFVVRVDRGRDDVRVTASSPDSLREIRVGFGAGAAAGPPAAAPVTRREAGCVGARPATWASWVDDRGRARRGAVADSVLPVREPAAALGADGQEGARGGPLVDLSVSAPTDEAADSLRALASTLRLRPPP